MFQIIDLCYKVLTSMHGSAYISDIDNLLEFSNELSTLRTKRQRAKQQNNCNGRPRLPLPDEDTCTTTENHYSSTPTLQQSRIGNNETEIFSLIDLESVDNVLVESKVDSGCSDSAASSNSSELSSPSGEYELIELKEMPKKCPGGGLLLDKAFEEQPLYQVYSEVSFIHIFIPFSSSLLYLFIYNSITLCLVSKV